MGSLRGLHRLGCLGRQSGLGLGLGGEQGQRGIDHPRLVRHTRAIQPGPFRHTPPTPLELECAIMVVEDVLMPLAARIPPHPVLHLQSPEPLTEVLGNRVQSRENIERLFGQLAAMVEGDPLASAQLPRDRHFAAALLILLVIRPVTGWIALLGYKADRGEKWTLAFFGIAFVVTVTVAPTQRNTTSPKSNYSP